MVIGYKVMQCLTQKHEIRKIKTIFEPQHSLLLTYLSLIIYVLASIKGLPFFNQDNMDNISLYTADSSNNSINFADQYNQYNFILLMNQYRRQVLNSTFKLLLGHQTGEGLILSKQNIINNFAQEVQLALAQFVRQQKAGLVRVYSTGHVLNNAETVLVRVPEQPVSVRMSGNEPVPVRVNSTEPIRKGIKVWKQVKTERMWQEYEQVNSFSKIQPTTRSVHTQTSYAKPVVKFTYTSLKSSIQS